MFFILLVNKSRKKFTKSLHLTKKCVTLQHETNRRYILVVALLKILKVVSGLDRICTS